MAANRERGELPLDVGGREYILKLTTNAMCEMETKLDRTMDSVMAGLAQGRLADLRVLLWAMLQENHGEQFPTLESAGKLVDDAGGLVQLKRKVEAVYKLNTKEAAAAAKKRNPRKARQVGTGDNSISTVARSV